MEEKIIRKVTGIGNGAHIFAPKEWLNEEVEIIRIPRKNPEEALKLIYPYLDKIIAVFLYGSYARNEQERNSDIDIFIISSEKFKIKSRDFEIMVVPEEKINLAKKLNPILFYSMLNEAKPIINSSYLEKLKKEKINASYFREFVEDTKKSIKSSEEIIGLDRRIRSRYASESVVYSLILRLRGVFIINLIFNKKKYFKEAFREWIAKNSEADYDRVYNIYRAVRDNKKPEDKVLIKQAESLLSFLIKEIKKLEKKI